MSRRRFITGQVFGQLKLMKRIGKGRNGEAWSCQRIKNNENSIFVIKLLEKDVKTKSYFCFRDEINILLKIKNIEGILPIVDYYLPKNIKSNSIPRYVMPLATQIDNY